MGKALMAQEVLFIIMDGVAITILMVAQEDQEEEMVQNGKVMFAQAQIDLEDMLEIMEVVLVVASQTMVLLLEAVEL